MYQLTDRCKFLRETKVSHTDGMQKYYLQRSVYFAIGGDEAAKKSLSPYEIFADATANVLNEFTPYIQPQELIVGFNFGDGVYEHALPMDTQEDRIKMIENGISEENIKRYFDADANYKSEAFRFGLNLLADTEIPFTQEERQMRREWAAIGRCICSNHSVIGYEKVLRLGFEGLLKETEEYEKKNGENPLYEGVKSLCKAALYIGEKYANEAERLMSDLSYNNEDLKKIVQTCRQVPRYPARTFMEAVQSLWFAHLINTWEDIINANSLGRLDQILYPYYKADIESGRITKEEAFELICLLWVKLYRDYDVQQSCVGGTNSDGSSAVNDLSYMMLDATEQLNFIRCLSVRYSSVTEKEFLKRALEVVGRVQKGVPFFFNDDVMIPSLLSRGIEKEDAYNYTQLGCVETLIPGKSNPHAVTGEANFLKAIEYTLGNGNSLWCPSYNPGIKTGELKTLDTYEKFYAAVLAQIGHILDVTCSSVKKACDNCISPKAYKSLLTEGCLSSMRDFNERGAIYDYYQIMFCGVPNLADSLMVIKKFVYEQKKYTLEELKNILLKDYPDESVRRAFINKAPKFGNDVDEVDCIAVDIVNYACDVLEKLEPKYDRSFHAQPFTFLWMIEHGRTSAASPDGRRQGEPIAYSVSPMQGRDFNGLTAVLNSIAKFPTKRTPGTTSAIVEVDPKLFTDENIDRLTDILIAASSQGLSNVQFNTIDAQTLLAAKKHPEKYNNLAVRVSGFSQKFNLLDPALQEHIIGRTKHTCL
ncbi:MAG: hypothetical protein E7364_04585 [Clostridiales bacterium]|nr:hypothetical protein [Clostridiales bacterium]